MRRPFRPITSHCELIDLGEPHYALQSLRLWPSESVPDEVQVTIAVYNGRMYQPTTIYAYDGPLTRDLPIGPTHLPHEHRALYTSRFLRIETRRNGPCPSTILPTSSPHHHHHQQQQPHQQTATTFPKWALIQVRQSLPSSTTSNDNEPPTHSRTLHFIPEVPQEQSQHQHPRRGNNTTTTTANRQHQQRPKAPSTPEEARQEENPDKAALLRSTGSWLSQPTGLLRRFRHPRPCSGPTRTESP